MTLNAGVAVSIEKVNITIADVDAELELVVRLGKPWTYVTHTFHIAKLFRRPSG